jgi:succinate dehydrogenase / fumarate reductase cytochrome b subunit
MLLFIVMHLLGNLEIYSGREATNQYGVFLRQFPKFLWSFRIALILAVILHVYFTISLNRRNQLARPVAYQEKHSRKASISSRTMILSGLTVLVFVCYHLAHYTLGITNPEFNTLVDPLGRHDVYNMVIMGFANPIIAGFYILANGLLAMHLSHGISSAARTLGLSDPKLFGYVHITGAALAWIMAMLFISIPLSVMLGILAPIA